MTSLYWQYTSKIEKIIRFAMYANSNLAAGGLASACACTISLVLFVAIIASSTVQANASTLYAHNLMLASDSYGMVGVIGSQSLSLANGFTTGANPDGYLLTRIHVRFVANPGDLTIALYNANGSSPGDAVSGFTEGERLPFSIYADTKAYLPNIETKLSPLTSYFLAIHPGANQPNSTFYFPDKTTSGLDASNDGWSIADQSALSTNLGNDWIESPGSLRFLVEATPVPEPQIFAPLVGLALLFFLILRRRLALHPCHSHSHNRKDDRR